MNLQNSYWNKMYSYMGVNLSFLVTKLMGQAQQSLSKETCRQINLTMVLTAMSQKYINGSAYLDNGSAGLGSQNFPGFIKVDRDLTLWSGTRHIYGDVYVGGNFRLKDAIIHGNVYVNGNVELGWTPIIDSNATIYYTGTLTYPNSYPENLISKCVKVSNVPTIESPNFDIPPLKPDIWYTNHGYFSGGMLADGKKIFSTGNYSFTSTNTFKNVIIVSKGDNTLNKWMHVTGVLFAPNGEVTFGGGSFEGLVIAKNRFDVKSGGSTVTFRNIEEYISDKNDYPFETGN